MRGRVMAVENVFIGASNELGAFESGVAGSVLGVGPAVTLGGVLTLGVVGVWWRLFPSLRDIDRFEDVAVELGGPCGRRVAGRPARGLIGSTAALQWAGCAGPPSSPARAGRPGVGGVRIRRGGRTGIGVDGRRCRPPPGRSGAAADTGVDGPGDHRASPATTDAGRATAQRRTTTTDRTVERLEPVGRLVDGNRVLVIGDSILASISNRHGGQLCDRLVPRGWAVEVNAETGQHVEYGRQVLRRRLRDGLGRRRGHAREQLRPRSGGLRRRARPAARRARPDAGRAGQRHRVQAGPRSRSTT